MWVAWQSTRNNQSIGRTDIIYKTYTNNAWSTDHNLTTTGWNSGPSLVQLYNGTILAFWSQKTGNTFLVYSSLTNGGAWTSPTRITITTLNDTLASATVARDGTIWLVWTRVNATNTAAPKIEQVFYKTWKNGVWSTDTQLTNDSNQNFDARVMVGKDGIVRVTYSKGAAGNIYQLYEKTYNGTVWTSDTQIVSSSSTDVYPSMIQDRNGTLWLFWSRLIVVSSLVQYYELWGKFSYNLGQTWSTEAQLTPTPGTKIFDSFMPSAVQTNVGVKPLWIIYTSNYNVQDYDIFGLMSTGIQPVHDVITTGLTVSNSVQYPGGLKTIGQSAVVTITVTVANIGDFLETVTATVGAANTTTTIVGTHQSLVGPGNTMNFYYYWNTTNANPGTYGFSVNISPIPGETFGNSGDNYYAKTKQLRMLVIGDVNQDGCVTIVDISIANLGYYAPVGSPRWNPYADFDGDYLINIVDISIVNIHYGQCI